MGQGSRVTTSVTAESRHVPRAAAASRKARISAWAVGSWLLPFVVARGDDLAVDQGDRTDGHVAVDQGQPGLDQGQSHGVGVVHPRPR